MKKFSFGVFICLLVVAVVMTSCLCPAAKEKPVKKQYYQGVQKQAPAEVVVAPGQGCDVCSLLKLTPHAPAEAVIGETYMSHVDVLALGNADEIKVISQIPAHLKYVKSDPPAQVDGNKLTWYLGAMNQGQTKNLKIWVMATQEGKHWLCYVPFALPRYCVPTEIGKAMLAISKKGPATADLNSEVTYTIVVENKGTAVARNVVVTDQIPEGMGHVSGKNPLTFELGDLAPNASKNVSVTLKALTRGNLCNIAVAKSANAGEVTDKACTQILKKDLVASINCVKEAFVGQEGTVTLGVSNAGDTNLTDVKVHIEYPAGVKLVSSDCAITPVGEKSVWNIGTLRAGTQVNCNAKVIGVTEGNHCVTMMVTSAEGLTQRGECCTLWKGVPKLEITKTAPATAKVGENFNYNVVVKNVGTGIARGVIVTDMIPPQVTHPQGKQLQYTIGDLAANSSRTIVIPVNAAQTGLARNIAKATATNTDPVEAAAETLIQTLSVSISWVKCTEEVLLGKQESARMVVKNTGGARLTNVVVTSNWPADVNVLAAEGNPTRTGNQAVWNLGVLEPGAERAFEIRLMRDPVKAAGRTCVNSIVTTAEGVKAEASCCTHWKGFPAFLMIVLDDPDPLLFGVEGRDETIYTITVKNQGTAQATNVKIEVTFRETIVPIQLLSGPRPGRIVGNKVVYEAMAEMLPKQEITYTIRAKARGVGANVGVQADLTCNEKITASASEFTQVY